MLPVRPSHALDRGKRRSNGLATVNFTVSLIKPIKRHLNVLD
jgi:hypothetical protein